MTASCESVTDLMLPKVSGNSPSTLCKLLIEFVLVIKSSFQAWQLFFVVIEDVEDDYIGSDLLPILLPTRDCALEAAIEASLWCRDQL